MSVFALHDRLLNDRTHRKPPSGAFSTQAASAALLKKKL
jgi:hypothetical protein